MHRVVATPHFWLRRRKCKKMLARGELPSPRYRCLLPSAEIRAGLDPSYAGPHVHHVDAEVEVRAPGSRPRQRGRHEHAAGGGSDRARNQRLVRGRDRRAPQPAVASVLSVRGRIAWALHLKIYDSTGGMSFIRLST